MAKDEITLDDVARVVVTNTEALNSAAKQLAVVFDVLAALLAVLEQTDPALLDQLKTTATATLSTRDARTIEFAQHFFDRLYQPSTPPRLQ